jgi:hypothetical protein
VSGDADSQVCTIVSATQSRNTPRLAERSLTSAIISDRRPISFSG